MKVLIVCSKNSGKVAPFIVEQAVSLEKAGVSIDYYYVQGKGMIGYLKQFNRLRSKIKTFQPDLLHAHYGLSGLLANLQSKVPVICTYHGSDINNDKVFFFSKISIRLSVFNIFVSEKNKEKANKVFWPRVSEKSALIPCGVDLEFFKPGERADARKLLGFETDKKYVLFAGAFDNRVKNATLAQKALKFLPDLNLLELKGYTREQVVHLMNAVDVVLMTSFTEGSPQFIKEAMACNCPVVSVPVGDVPEVIDGINGCYLASYDPIELSEKLKIVLNSNLRTEGRVRIKEKGLDVRSVTMKIIDIYNMFISEQFRIRNAK